MREIKFRAWHKETKDLIVRFPSIEGRRMSLKDKKIHIRNKKDNDIKNYCFEAIDVKEAVVKREEVTQNRINSIINMDEKDFEITDNMLGIKNWILGILEAEKQDNKEIFGDFK